MGNHDGEMNDNAWTLKTWCVLEKQEGETYG